MTGVAAATGFAAVGAAAAIFVQLILLPAALVFAAAYFLMSRLVLNAGEALSEDAASLPALCGTACGVAAATALFFKHRAPRLCAAAVGPPGIPFFGSFMLLFKNRNRQPNWFHEMDLAFGRQGRAWQFAVPRAANGVPGGVVTSLNTPANVRHCLRDNFENYVKSPNLKDILQDFIGTGIFSSDGALWRMHRKVASHMFSQLLLREGTKIAVDECRSLVRRLLKAAESKPRLSSDQDVDQEVDMQDLFFRFTMDVFANIAFGVELKSLERATPHPFAAAFDGAQEHAKNRLARPTWRVERLLWWLFPAERAFRRHIKVMDDFLAGVIHAKRRDAKESRMGPDLISRFLSKGGGFGHAEAFTDKELRDIAANFLIAGRDTTACALSWTLFELIRNPHAAKLVREEADRVFVEKPGGGSTEGGSKREVDADDSVERGMLDLLSEVTFQRVTKELPYTHAVVTEALRLHPSVPNDMKSALRDDTLPDGTKIPAHSVVVYSSFALGRNETQFADPLVFRPERWLDKGNKSEPGMFQTAVFNATPRYCLGKPLAYLEVKLLTAVLAQRFDFSAARPLSEEYRSSLVMPMLHGLATKVRVRAE